LVEELARVAGDDLRCLRLSRATNVHLTIHFLGDLDEDLEAAVNNGLPAALDLAPFDITLERLGTFPNRRAPRVVWVDVNRGRHELTAIHRELGIRLRAAGVALESRPFTPHLTLARVRDGQERRARRVADRLSEVRVPVVSWHVAGITRFHSDLSGAAPRYVAVQPVALRPTSTAARE
jgi:2'-5' RNA ligase